MKLWGRMRNSLPTGTVWRWVAVGLMLALYAVSRPKLHFTVGDPSFLLGHIICLLAAALLGIRGAFFAIVVTVAHDRYTSMLFYGAAANLTAGVIALLAKLVVAGGTAMFVDRRRKEKLLIAKLQLEMEGRVKSETSLRRSESLHRALFESLGEGVGLFDEHDYCVTSNRALQKTLGRTQLELENHPFHTWFAESATPADADGSPRCYELSPHNRSEALLMVTETRLEQPWTAAALTLRVVRDLSDHIAHERRERDLERELQRSQALQSLAVLAGGVAHDFNNLLNGVIGNAELAQRKLRRGLHEDLEQYVGEVLTFATEATQLSKQMLAYAGGRSLSIGPLDANREIAEALRLLHATIESQAKLQLDLSADLPAIAADKFQLRQVLTNLIFNALEAMADRRGQLTLSSVLVTVDEQQREYGLAPGKYVKLSVSDTGSGIEEDDRDRIFEPFFSTKARGRGMGLAAAAGIVRTHRGWLGVDGGSSSGATISLMLPLAHSVSLPAATSTPPPATAGRAGTVLVVDDEHAVRLVSARLLRELGQKVLTATGSMGALQTYAQNHTQIDWVLLDLTMPDQSGAEVLADLTKIRPDVRVVLTSGFHPERASELLANPNVVSFLEKPHTLAGLEAALAAASPPPSGRIRPQHPPPAI